MFETIDKQIKITPIFSHNDSPRASKNEITLNGIGAKEYFEANQIQNVLTYYKNKFQGFSPLYLGDTNIKLGKQDIAFSSINNNEYNFAFVDKKEYSSSLTTSKSARTQLEKLLELNKTIKNKQDIETNKIKYSDIFKSLYANPYDKIIYDNNLETLNYNDVNEVSTFTNLELSNTFIELINSVYFVNPNLVNSYRKLKLGCKFFY